jgi:predicted RNase H-like HicB family nuclease
MTSHAEILAAALRICAARGAWTFGVDEIVRALPHLNAGTVRTHVTSRCCVNAPTNHPHKWDYFRRIGRGTYEITRAYRTAPGPSHSVARETTVPYGEPHGPRTPSRIVHATVAHRDRAYTAECLDLPVLSQGRTLDETLADLKNAIAIHLEGEDIDSVTLELHVPLSIDFDEADELETLAAHGRLHLGTGAIDDEFWALPAPRVPARALRAAIARERDER